MAPLSAPQTPQIQLTAPWWICLSWMDASKVKNWKSIEMPPVEAGRGMKFAWAEQGAQFSHKMQREGELCGPFEKSWREGITS